MQSTTSEKDPQKPRVRSYQSHPRVQMGGNWADGGQGGKKFSTVCLFIHFDAM